METKQVIVIRKDLKMRRGKEIAQGSHASMAWMSWLIRRTLAGQNVILTDAQTDWIEGSFAKIVVQVDSEEELRKVHEAAVLAGLESHLITDAGRTEFSGQPTVTACGIGPDYADRIDAVTKDLKLY